MFSHFNVINCLCLIIIVFFRRFVDINSPLIHVINVLVYNSLPNNENTFLPGGHEKDTIDAMPLLSRYLQTRYLITISLPAGMRALKSVLVMAGSLKRQNPDTLEDIVLIRALRDSNLPKFLKDDAVLFQVSRVISQGQ